MTLTDILAVIAIVVSGGSLLVAMQAKRQAKQSAALPHRIEAIVHLYKAAADIQMSRVVNSSAKVNIEAPKQAANVVFSQEVRDGLRRAIQTADHLLRRRVEGLQVPQQEVDALEGELQRLIQRMNDEATLR